MLPRGCRVLDFKMCVDVQGGAAKSGIVFKLMHVHTMHGKIIIRSRGGKICSSGMI